MPDPIRFKTSQTFQGDHLSQIAMPVGGIGAGSVCLNGHGGLQDFGIRHRPHLSATVHRRPGDAAFALLHVEGSRSATRLIEGAIPTCRISDRGLQGLGYCHGDHEGLPRFSKCLFRGEYPFGQAELSDRRVPLRVLVTGWNPFIPLDDVASGIPCAIQEYTFKNVSKRPVHFQFSYHLAHMAIGEKGGEAGTRNRVIPERGIFFSNTEPRDSETFGSASLSVIGHRPLIKAMWFRGSWFDAMAALWREVESGRFAANDGSKAAAHAGRNGGSVLVKARLQPGEETTIPVLITWHFPNSHLNAGIPDPPAKRKTAAKPIPWRPFYAGKWRDARDVADYVHTNYASLRGRTLQFRDALFGSTLPGEALDAISANLAIMKSPTVLRLENGNLWGWEGCGPTGGSCHGSCTHVWNYAQSFPHLFPKLERTLREQELLQSMDETGHINFRAALPHGPTRHTFHPAADGQLGGIMKLYRDWQICGDDAWLRGLYSAAKKSIEYCIGKWDPDRKGALFEPHHNTYDIEFWGPDGMCGTIYAGALCAMAAIADALGEASDAAIYRRLSIKAARYLDDRLFNGAYFEQKVQFRGLRDKSFCKLIASAGKDSDEMLRLLKREGPKYQYGTGCLSDGVIGAWMAAIYGIETPVLRKNVRRHLQSVVRHNFRKSLATHVNTQRPGYAVGDEPGLILCSWPRGNKPVLPFIYSDEVWTGIEYQVASHLIEEGLVREGLAIVKAARSRYDGRVRNPWNEYECGNYYARAMASFALLNSLSGFRYSAVEKTLWLHPKLPARPFRAFFSAASGFGVITLGQKELTIEILEGELRIEHLRLVDGGKAFNAENLAVSVTPTKPYVFSLPARGTTLANHQSRRL